MNLLLLKINFSKTVFLFTLLSFSNLILANNGSVDSTFLEFCKNSDAYLLYSYTDVSYSKSWGTYLRQTSISNKMVINNRSGVEKYAFLYMNNYIADNLKEFKIKTLKADGTVVELDSSDVFKEQSPNKDGGIKYPIPGVEPGDTIEVNYLFSEDLRRYELYGFVNLYGEIPSINTEHSVRITADFTIRYKEYNGFPEPKILNSDTMVYCLFKMENVIGLSKNDYTCMSCELPYLYYNVNKRDSKATTWKDVYNNEFNFITQPILLDREKSSYYRRWKKKVIGDAKDSSKYYKFNLLQREILMNYNIEEAKRGELVKSSGFFLKEKRFDPISIRRLYRQILEDLEIDYWAVFARSKRAGNIDVHYIRKGEYDHIFFAYVNQKGSLNLLYPHDISFKYQINEIPTSLYNTQAVIAKPVREKKMKKKDKFINYDLKLAEADSVTINMINLPGLSSNYNYLNHTVYCDIDIKKKQTALKSNFYISGGLSTDLRSFYSELNQNKEMSEFYDAKVEYEGDDNAIDIDTVLKTNLGARKPFVYKIYAKGKLKNSLTFLNDSLVSITLNKIILHSEVESDEDSTKLNYYLDYSYGDLLSIAFNFPCKIELMSLKNKIKHVKNKYGEYLFNVSIANEKQLILQSHYKVFEDVIPKKEYLQLKEINNLLDEIKNMRLLIKLKDID